MDFKGKVALVTGGGRGIGAATARLLGEEGAHVVINYLNNASTANDVVEYIQAHGGKALAIQADGTDEQQAQHLARETIHAFGRIDILVHSVPPHAVFKPFMQMSWEEFAKGVNSELKAVFACTKAVLPQMLQQNYGRIVYVGSGVAKTPGMAGGISLGTAKAGLVAFARYIAKEFGPSGITANVIAPGMVETELSARIPPEHKQNIIRMTPLGRIAQPKDIARVIAFFASDFSGFMTGAYAPVNGGMTME